MEVSGQLHALAVYRRGKSPRYPLDRRLPGPQSRSGCGGENKSIPLPESYPGRPTCSRVTIMTDYRRVSENNAKENFLAV
jgi:hypothetical protein